MPDGLAPVGCSAFKRFGQLVGLVRPAFVDLQLLTLSENLLSELLVEPLLRLANAASLEPLLLVVLQCSVKSDFCLSRLHYLLLELVDLLPQVLLLAVIASLSEAC